MLNIIGRQLSLRPMQKSKKRNWPRMINIFLISYFILGAAFYYFNERLIFRATPLDIDYKFGFDQPFREINLAISEKKNLNIVQFTVADSVPKGVVLYFHGNTQNIERYAKYAKNFTPYGYEVWMIDYPGYGKTTGPRSEEIMYADAVEMYKMARSKFNKSNILLYGKSLGTGIASYIASTRDCKQLILETPYYSMDDVVRKYAFMYPLSILSKFHFPSYKYFKNIEVPITIFHGTNDAVISYRNAKRLMKIAPEGSVLITLPKGEHNNIASFELYKKTLDSLLKR